MEANIAMMNEKWMEIIILLGAMPCDMRALNLDSRAMIKCFHLQCKYVGK